MATNRMTCPRAAPSFAASFVALFAASFATLVLSAAAANAEINPYFVGVTQSFSHYSNLLGLAEGQPTPDGTSRADTASSTALVAGIDQPFGRQRFAATVSLRDSRYNENSRLNNNGYTASAGLDWSTAERIGGSVSASTNRSLSNLNSYQLSILNDRNYETTQSLNATVSMGVVTQYSLEFGVNYRQVRNSLQQEVVLTRDFDQEAVSLGLRWRPVGGTTFGVGVRGAQGRYPKFRFISDAEGYQADRFKQPSIDFSATLQPSGASALDARLSYATTRYDLNSERNFSGVTGTLGWTWQASGKVRVGTRLTRDTGQDSYATTAVIFPSLPAVPSTSEYSRVNNTLRVQADYEASAKIGINAAVQVVQRSVVQTVKFLNVSQPSEGKDTTTTLSLGARWAPLRSVAVGCDISNDGRTHSGELTSDLKANSFSCYGQFQLQQ